jgi:tetratricopeptide (TPR) repeat protein
MKRYSKTLAVVMIGLAAVFICGAAISHADVKLQQPEPAAQAEEPESSPEYIEQYDAWEKAKNEPDLQKSAALLIQFLEKYPKSELLKHAENSYSSLLVRCSDEKKFQDLEILAEQWLKLHPGDLQAIAYKATAAKELGHNEKWTQSLVEIYIIRPSGNLANEIAQAYTQTENKAKYLEWTEIALRSPEYETDFRTRLDLVQFYAGEKNLSKAVEYARAALKAADLVKDPSEETMEQLRKVRKACHHTIGILLLEQEKFDEAIKAFQQALSVEKSGESCYYIAYCLRMQKNIEEAMLWYARAEQQGGEYASKAKENLEQLYKAIHNNTLIGIEKIYRKAKDQSDTAEARIQEK